MTARWLWGPGLRLLLVLLPVLVPVSVSVLPVLLVSLGSLSLPLLFPPLPLLVPLPLPFSLTLSLPALTLSVTLSFPLAFSLSVLSLSFPLPFAIVMIWFCFCILHPEILVLSTTPKPLYLIVIIRVCIRLKCCVSDISWDPRIPISEDFIFFVKFPVVFTNGYCEPFFFKVGLLLFPNGCLFQNLFCMSESTFPGTLCWGFWRGWRQNFINYWPTPRVGRHQWVRSKRRGTVGWKRFRFGDEGVVPLVIHSRVYKPTVHSPRAVSFNLASEWYGIWYWWKKSG